MDCNEIFSVIDNINDKYLAFWEKACNIESPTSYKKGIDEVGRLFTDTAKELGFDVEVLEHDVAGNAICITLNPESSERPVVFSGHIDTVHPLGLFGTPAVHYEDDRICGPGVMDCKGGTVASLMALEALSKCGFKNRPVKLIIQTDEETGSKTSDKETIAFMLEKARGAVAFLNTEGIQKKTAVIKRKGILRYSFDIRGRAVHSSKCDEGASAILEAAYKIIELEKLKDQEGITCNCGTIEGGTVANSVAETCSFVADIRFSDENQLAKVEEIVRKVASSTTVEGCTCLLEKVSFRPAMPLCAENLDLLSRMNEIYRECSLPELSPRFCLSGSDAAYTTEAGIPTIDNIGVNGGRIHSIDEFAYLSSLAECAKRLVAVAVNI